MRSTISFLTFLGLLLVSDATTVTKVTTTVIKRQDGPVDPSTDPDCSFYDTAYSVSDDCNYFESNWGISHADFVAWNPSVLADCSGIKMFNSYCVEVTRPQPPTSTASSTSSTTSVGSSRPSPTQIGLIESCTAFYKAVSGDTCDKVVSRYSTFDFQQFLLWNPAVGSDCSGLQLNVYYCVGIPGTPTAPSTTRSATTTTGNGIQTPQPTQRGMVNNCDDFYFVQPGDNCQVIAQKYRITLTQLTTWNNVGGSSCTGLEAGVNVCVSIVGHTPSTATTTTKASSTTLSTGIQTPQPTQPGMVSNCDAFYFVKSGDTCQVIADRFRITITQFTSWNSVGGASCTALQASVNVCVSIIGHSPPASSTGRPSTTTPSNGIQTPQPTQPGMVSNCDAFYFVRSGDGCQAIADRFGILLSQLTTWNNVGGASCTGLQANVNVCVSIIGHTPTIRTTTTVSTCVGAPTPTQPGSLCRCLRWHRVISGQTCATIQSLYGISATNFNAWNPQVGSNCQSLFLNYYVCVGV